jgi:hypothetical protein
VEDSVVHYGLLGIHLIVGFVLVYIGTRAFKKTKYPPMALLAVGFSLIVIGDTILGDILPFVEESIIDWVEEVIEISGFIVLIIAVKRS